VALVVGSVRVPLTSYKASRLMPSPKILLVEDDPAIRTLMVAWLDTAGYNVRTASNGREALVRLREEAPCLMVVDLNQLWAGKGGYERWAD
jgi:CheY-like chemotaxis protein